LSFTVVAMDCPISSVLIGDYQCTDIVIDSSTSFHCTTPPITFAATYSVSIRFNDTTVVYTGERVEVTSASNTTRALMSIRFLAHPPIYSLGALLALLGRLAGIDPSSIVETYDSFVPNKKRDVLDTSEVHDAQLSITSSTQTSATDIAQLLVETVPTPSATAQFQDIGVEILEFDLSAICDSTGDCECEPNYAPPSCQTKALCPNNCTSNGECVDGSLGRVCSCDVGYTGRDCSTLTCINACSGHGSCQLQSGSAPVCQCDSGWEGGACNITVPCPSNCSGFGTCMEGACVCQSGYSGSDCSEAATAIVGGTVNEEQKTDNTVLGVVIAVVGVIFLVAVGLVIYVVIERRRAV